MWTRKPGREARRGNRVYSVGPGVCRWTKGVETEAVARILFPDAVAKTVLTRLDADQEADL